MAFPTKTRALLISKRFSDYFGILPLCKHQMPFQNETANGYGKTEADLCKLKIFIHAAFRLRQYPSHIDLAKFALRCLRTLDEKMTSQKLEVAVLK